MTSRSDWVVIIVILFLLSLLGLGIKMYMVLPAAHEERIERLCAPKEESEWAYLAPPMEKTDEPVHEECRKAAEGSL